MQRLRQLSFIMLLMSLMTLVACGGGSGDCDGNLTGNSCPKPDDEPVSITLSKSDGNLSGDNDITLTATVMQGSTAVANKLVTFEFTDATLALFSPEVGTAVTNNEGIATIIVKATSSDGGVEVTASISDSVAVRLSFTSLGGGDDGGAGGPIADSLSLFATTQQLASSGAQAVILTAIAKDSNNNLLEGVTINFAADSGSLENVANNGNDGSNISGPDGKVIKKLTTLADQTNRIIRVDISSGLASDSIEIEVVGTSITLTGSSSLAINEENIFIIKVLDSDGRGLASSNVSLSFAEAAPNIELPESVLTDFTGQASVIVKGIIAGSNTIIASSLGASASQYVTIQSDSFLFSDFGDGSNNINPSTDEVPDIALSKTASVTLTWLRSGELVPDGTIVGFTSTRGTLDSPSATTMNGKVTAILTSNNAGKALITFTGQDTVNGQNIELNNQLEFEFFADTAENITAQAFPDSIGPNDQTSTISVVVRDATGNLVKNKTVDFSLTDTNGGNILPASAVTDSNGVASTVYTSANTSANEGVMVSATVRDTPSVSDSVTLTVADREVFISLGTGNTIIISDDETNYTVKYSVFVTDIESNPVENIEISVSAIPKNYKKGIWVPIFKGVSFDHYETLVTATCDNEDKDKDGELDAGEDDDPINGNNNGRLTPGNIVSASGDRVTDEKGRTVIDITYGENYGAWATIDLIVSAKVRGTESFAQAIFRLPVADADVTTEGSPPGSNIPFVSDFGRDSNCTNPD